MSTLRKPIKLPRVLKPGETGNLKRTNNGFKITVTAPEGKDPKPSLLTILGWLCSKQDCLWSNDITYNPGTNQISAEVEDPRRFTEELHPDFDGKIINFSPTNIGIYIWHKNLLKSPLDGTDHIKENLELVSKYFQKQGYTENAKPEFLISFGMISMSKHSNETLYK